MKSFDEIVGMTHGVKLLRMNKETLGKLTVLSIRESRTEMQIQYINNRISDCINNIPIKIDKSLANWEIIAL